MSEVFKYTFNKYVRIGEYAFQFAVLKLDKDDDGSDIQ